MKYIKHNQLGRIEQGLLAISLIVVGGCAEWSSTPARTQTDYGASVRNMVNKQIYNNANNAQHPAASLPNGIEGNKATTILNQAYRKDIGNPGDINHSTLGNANMSGSGGSGGSTR
ncbi:MAG: hypothetical protein ACXWAT_09785 [Methylobacter sp.]